MPIAFHHKEAAEFLSEVRKTIDDMLAGFLNETPEAAREHVQRKALDVLSLVRCAELELDGATAAADAMGES